MRSMAQLIIWIVEDSGELTKACLYIKHAADKVFPNDGHQSCFQTMDIKSIGLRFAPRLTKGKCIIVC